MRGCLLPGLLMCNHFHLFKETIPPSFVPFWLHVPYSYCIPTSPGPLVAILHQSTRCPQTFLLAFQILPLPSAPQALQSTSLYIHAITSFPSPARFPTCTSSPHQPLNSYTSPDPLFPCQIAVLMLLFVSVFQLDLYHISICLPSFSVSHPCTPVDLILLLFGLFGLLTDACELLYPHL